MQLLNDHIIINRIFFQIILLRRGVPSEDKMNIKVIVGLVLLSGLVVARDRRPRKLWERKVYSKFVMEMNKVKRLGFQNTVQKSDIEMRNCLKSITDDKRM